MTRNANNKAKETFRKHYMRGYMLGFLCGMLFVFLLSISLFYTIAVYSYASTQGVAPAHVVKNSASSPYSFNALIGSVLNTANEKAGELLYTKSLQTSTTYTYQNVLPYPVYDPANPTNPIASPYSVVTSPPISTYPAVNAITNGGGVAFASFQQASAGANYDNIMQVSPSQLSTLLSNSGTWQEYEYLWFTGFPVYDQQASSLAVVGAGGAYQVIFGNVISNTITSTSISLYGGTHTVSQLNPPSANANSVDTVAGGSVNIDGTVYSSGGQAPITSSGWNVIFLWDNPTTTSSNAPATSLYSIIFYNTNPATLLPGQSENFYAGTTTFHKLMFNGLTSNNLDPMRATIAYNDIGLNVSAFGSSFLAYTNQGAWLGGGAPHVPTINEALQELTISSSIPGAFSSAAGTTNSVTYALTPFALQEQSSAHGISNALAANIVLSYTDPNAPYWVTSTEPIDVSISGYLTSSNSSFTTLPRAQVISSNDPTLSASYIFPLTNFYSITDIILNRPLPAPRQADFKISIYYGDNSNPTVSLATLYNLPPMLIYPQPGGSGTSVLGSLDTDYTQPGQHAESFYLDKTPISVGTNPITPGSSSTQYFTYAMGEAAGGGLSDNIILPMITTASSNGVISLIQPTYQSSQGLVINTQQGFITERGSQIGAATSLQDSISLSESVNHLSFTVT
ncbi:MAG: hypothetical protein ACHQX1_00815 [Candidatus Micrarchaeales archaeon]